MFELADTELRKIEKKRQIENVDFTKILRALIYLLGRMTHHLIELEILVKIKFNDALSKLRMLKKLGRLDRI